MYKQEFIPGEGVYQYWLFLDLTVQHVLRSASVAIRQLILGLMAEILAKCWQYSQTALR